jgi:manganese/zinc-transporting P-type ATPase C
MVGSRHFIQDDEAVGVSQADSVMEACPANGQSALYVTIGRKLAGIIAIHDPLRTDAHGFVDALRVLGIEKIAQLTGDYAPTAANVARALGITSVHAQAFSKGRYRWSKAFQKKGLCGGHGRGRHQRFAGALTCGCGHFDATHGAEIARCS